MTTPRNPLGHATYPGAATDHVGELVGMSGFNEPLVVVDATRLEDGSTRLAFDIARKGDLDPMFTQWNAARVNREEHPAFFGDLA
jgi:hypothetical protein